MNLHDGGSEIWTDGQLSTKVHAIADALQKQVKELEQLCSEGLSISEAEFTDLELLGAFIFTLHSHARELSRNAVPSLVDRRFPIKCIYEHGLSEKDTTGYYVGRSGVTGIVPYIERGEAWLAVYQGDHICARVPAKAMIITYEEVK